MLPTNSTPLAQLPQVSWPLIGWYDLARPPDWLIGFPCHPCCKRMIVNLARQAQWCSAGDGLDLLIRARRKGVSVRAAGRGPQSIQHLSSNLIIFSIWKCFSMPYFHCQESPYAFNILHKHKRNVLTSFSKARFILRLRRKCTAFRNINISNCSTTERAPETRKMKYFLEKLT